MILIADSGATKTTWVAATTHILWQYTTPGMNPTATPRAELEATARQVQQYLQAHPATPPQEPTHLHFYGAGCGNNHAISLLSSALQPLFPHTTLGIATDLLGACRAACGTRAGRVAILGTGSNACCYDGTRITVLPPSPGYLLADEGSGCHIGKALLRDYLRHHMPEDVSAMFQDTYHLTYPDAMQHLYRSPNANRYIASFAPFAAQHIAHPYLQNIVQHSFQEWYAHCIAPLPHPEWPLHLVGGVAHAFRSTLQTLCATHGTPTATILPGPLPTLLSYHLQMQPPLPKKP